MPASSTARRRAALPPFYNRYQASIMVGATHRETASLDAGVLPGPTPEFFFAPARAEQRAAELGPSPFQQRVGAAWAALADRVPGVLEIEFRSGPDALGQTDDSLVDGSAEPGKGYVFAL